MQSDNLGLWPINDKVPKGYKRCSKCGFVKVLELFNKDSRTKDSRTYQCKECQKVRAKSSYKKTKTKAVRQARYQENKKENRERARAYYHENKEVILAQQKEYLQTKKGKAVMKKAHTKRNKSIKDNKGKPYVRFQIITRDSKDAIHPETGEILNVPYCQICGEPIWDLNDVHIDHIVPIAEGGLDCYDNVRCTHAKCNLTRPRADVLKREEE